MYERGTPARTKTACASTCTPGVIRRGGPGRDPRRRRNPGGHQLPPRDRVVPSVRARAARPFPCGGSTVTSGWAATRSSRRSPATSSRRSTATPCARPRRERYMDLIGEVERASRRARARRAAQGRGAHGGAGQLGEGATRSSTTWTCWTRASWPTRGPPRRTWRPPSPRPTWWRSLSKGGDHDGAVMVGDSTFDCEAAGRAGVPTLGVLTGGFSEQELLDAGAASVFESPRGAAASSAGRLRRLAGVVGVPGRLIGVRLVAPRRGCPRPRRARSPGGRPRPPRPALPREADPIPRPWALRRSMVIASPVPVSSARNRCPPIHSGGSRMA